MLTQEFDRQVMNLIRKGYPELTRLTPTAFSTWNRSKHTCPTWRPTSGKRLGHVFHLSW